MSDCERLRARLRLHLADGVGAILHGRLVDRFGGAVGAVAAGKNGWKSVEGIGPKTADAIGDVTDQQIDEEIEIAASAGVRIIAEDDADYPPALKVLDGHPAVIYVRGQLEQTDAVAIGVVGSRRCTHYGMEQAERFGELLGQAGFTVVSGGARGIDTAAHRGALRAGGRTIAVMGCGLSTHYPAENEKLFEQIVTQQQGAIVSELPMRTAVLSGNFPTRNRIISGLSLGVLVVEAAQRSGALITAREAAEQGKLVFAVPGPVSSPMSRGTNALIRDGVILAQSMEDIVEHLGDVGATMVPEAEPAEFTMPHGLTEHEQQLLTALGGGGLSVDALVTRTNIESAKVVASMTMLVLKGHVTQHPGNEFALRSNQGRGN